MKKSILYLLFIGILTTSCSRQQAMDDYIRAGMPPELARNGIMMSTQPPNSECPRE